MYEGRLDITLDIVVPLIVQAEYFGIEELTQQVRLLIKFALILIV